MPAVTDSKQTWRSWAKNVRAELDTHQLSKQVCNYLQTWEAFEEAEHILLYLAFGSEITLKNLHKMDKALYVTRTWFEPEPHLTIHRLDNDLERHRYGYWQPVASAPLVEPGIIDLALVPGLAFDNRGTRLGYGMGFYDRLLPQLRDVKRVGIAASALVVDVLPSEPFDVSMTDVVTERGTIL